MHTGQVMQKPTTYRIQRADDSPHIQTRRLLTLHSYASNHRNARCSQSVPPITISTLVSYTTYLSLIIFKIIPHPMTLLIAFPWQVIILSGELPLTCMSYSLSLSLSLCPSLSPLFLTFPLTPYHPPYHLFLKKK
jgi:hypothetical protein